MTQYSPDPEIRLRQKYDPSNRPFEDSLFLEVDQVSCGTPECEGAQYATSEANAAQALPAGIEVQADGFHPESGSARARVGLTTNKHSEYAHVSERTSRDAGAAYQERGIGQPEQDICANKHKGDSASKDANLRISASKREICQQILKFAMLNGSHGVTLNEVVSHLGLKVQTASARLSELRRDGVLVPKGDIRREHCSVLIPNYAENL